jgi:plastocyanin
MRPPALAILCAALAGTAGVAPLPAAELVLTLTDAASAPVVDAVVSLHPLDAPVPAPGPAAEVEVVQRDGEFQPLVTAVRAGTRVRFPNADSIQHHVYSLSPAKRFDIPLHGGASAPAEEFAVPGVVSVGCNIHDWMRAYVVVLDTPWFALSSAAGLARLEAPAGRYRVEIWHYRVAKPDVSEITLVEARPEAAARGLVLRRDRRPARAPETGGGGYR